MTSYVDIAQVAQQTQFLGRIRYALYIAAINVYAEDPGTPNHAARAAFAGKVTSGQADLASAALSVLTNPSIAAEAAPEEPNNGIPDGDIQFAMNSVFNALAGA